MKPVKTIDEFFALYDRDLTKILRSKTFRWLHNEEEIEDTKNDIYAHLIEKGFFSKYDETKAAFSTFLYKYIYYHLKGKKVKEDKKPRHLSIDSPVAHYEEGDKTFMDILSAEPKGNYLQDIKEEWIEIRPLVEKRLRKKYKSFDAWEFWLLIESGTQINTIAEKFGYTPLSTRQYRYMVIDDVMKCVRKVRQEI